MAKRFIDTDLFRKPLMRSLQAPYKVLWVYLLCECDHAGIWDVELDVAAMRLGVKIDPAKCMAAFGSAIVEIDGGKKWWIPEFVAFQYGTLNPANKVHASVLSMLGKHDINPNEQGATKPLASPFQGAKDKDKDTDKDKAMDQEEGVQGKPKGPNLEVSAVVDHLTAALKSAGIAQSLDGSVKDNRWAAQSLLQKLAKDYPGHDALESAKALINAAVKDPFHGRNATSVRYLFNNCGKIAASFKANGNATAKGSPVTPDEAARATAEYFDRKRAGQPVNG